MEEAVGPSRRRDYVEARQLISKYLKDQGWTYREIGELLGNAPTSTSVYAVKAATNLLDVDAQIRLKWLKLLQGMTLRKVKRMLNESDDFLVFTRKDTGADVANFGVFHKDHDSWEIL